MPRGSKTQTTTERGYGHAHQKQRAEWQRRVDAGGVHCYHYPCCIRPEDTLIHPGEPWDLEHHPITKEPMGPGHRACNRGTSKQWMDIALATSPDYRWFE